jgi:putative proteasome-type protease
MKSNLSVGMPLDVAIYRNDDLNPCFVEQVDEHNEYFHQLRSRWHEGLQGLFNEIAAPSID